MNPQLIVTALVLAPMLGALVVGLFGRRLGDVASMSITTGLLFLACALAWLTFFNTVYGDWHFTKVLAPFIDVGTFRSAWSVRVDSLSAVMLIVVTTVSALVHLYSWGYMAEDDSKPRFFAYLSLFTFAMLALVTAADFMQLFFGWEGVGLASYLLIGFWFRKPAPPAAAIKAFVVNRVGDFGFALGIMTTYWVFGTIRFAEIFPHVAEHAKQGWEFAGHQFYAVDLACALLFVGAMGKSAQFFLHTWLPDAMEGPTPVSALIHAATMVTAGVYMVCLLSPMFEYAPVARSIVCVIGAVTALFAATVGLAQNDIKRVIAYSTCSQLGYMFFAAGVGAYQASMFHLFTHAFFKGLLFLSAGSVINAMHHEQDMRAMGGLWKKIPVTYAVMIAGTLAITGVGIPYLDLGFAGFYSKDSIIDAAYNSLAHGSFVGGFAFIAGIFAAGLTSFYSWRLIFMTFHGTPKWAADALSHDTHGHDAHGHDDHAGDHHGPLDPHESPPVMLIPLLLLALGAVAAGFAFAPSFIGEGRDEFWKGAIFNLGKPMLIEAPELPLWVVLSPLIVTAIGFVSAWWVYVRHEGMGARIAARKGPIWSFLYNKWYFDELYDATFVAAARWLGDLFWKGGDQKIIDGLGPDGVSAVSAMVGQRTGRFQTGYVYHYAFVMLIGVVALLSYGLWFFSGSVR
ncbi:MAG TPA: NADH-quinone oxidoreductase subunit L [Caulobacteraceae bacterium]|jgi:NADH-quinone oxidoreductase subunit L